MCTHPQKLPTGETVRCRACASCLQARKGDWIARAMAEKATSPYTYVLALTYRPNPDGTTPDGAKAFRYSDLEAFWRLLRITAQRAEPERKISVRYMVVGEKGADKKRVHWHCVIFTNADLSSIGKWTDMNGNTEPMHLPEPCEPVRRQLWTIWPHGLVTVQSPDQGGMAYVTKYILKDQMGMEKARGHDREHQSDVYAASFFRMSKYPPIGTDYLVQKIREWRAGCYVPVTTELQVPGLKGFWWPVGQQRELFVKAAWAINAEHKFRQGRDLPQYAALKASVGRLKQGEEGADFQTLQYGIFSDDYTDHARLFALELDRKSRAREAHYQATRNERACYGILTCNDCWKALTPDQRRRNIEYFGAVKARYAREGLSTDPDDIHYAETVEGNRNGFCARAARTAQG